ncbi:glycosyltransferase family 4 protein [Pectobacterium colocasium]|uniref:glycosyltransferase family 4 protein n=1 Tax=Pectobacterium colocasium TaxID=2878098 RepID=UPI003B28D2B5
MNVGMYCNWMVKPCHGGFYISSLEAKYLLEFKKVSSELVLLSGVSSEAVTEKDVFISSDIVSLIALPEMKSYILSSIHFFAIAGGIKELLNRTKFIYVRTPEPFSWLFFIFKNKHHVINYHFTSNPIDLIKRKYKNHFFKKIIILSIFYFEFYLICISAYFCRSSSNGPSVIDEIPFFLKGKMRVLVESTLDSDVDVFKRDDINNEGLNFLCVSRLMPAKGLETLIDAFNSLMPKHGENIKLFIGGDGPLDFQLKEKVRILGLEDSVKFLGFLSNGEELNQIYKKADVFVNPSFSETGPRVLLEAMSHSVFCISTDVGYAKLVMMKNDICLGRIIDIDDVDMLRDSMEYAIFHKWECLQIGNDCSEVAKKYTLNKFVRDIFYG